MTETERRIRQAGGGRVYAETSGRPQYEPTRAFYERLGFARETQLKDFYALGDDKVFYVKVL
jgi:ribosomal protein S18 acetylase RimI-like enzyme